MVRCPGCGRAYNDERQWTICPHAPIGAGLNDYCLKHDLSRWLQPEEWRANGCPHKEEKVEETKVKVEGDIGVAAELGWSDVNLPGTEELTQYERMFLNGARRLIRARIEAILAAETEQEDASAPAEG